MESFGSFAGDFPFRLLEEDCRNADVSVQETSGGQGYMLAPEKEKQSGRRRDCDVMPYAYETAPILEEVDEEEEDLSSSLPHQ